MKTRLLRRMTGAALRAGLLLMVASAVSAGPAMAEDVIRALTFAPPDRDDLSMVILRQYFDTVNEAGEGVVRIEHIGGPDVVPLPDQVNAVSKGGIADWVMTFTVHSAVVPEIGTVGLSRISPQEEREVGFIDLLDEAHEKINIKVIGRTATNGGFHIFSKKPIESIADFKGIKIRSHSGYDAFFEALDAEPIHMQISEIYVGLERGLVQAAPYPLFVSGLGLHEVICCAMADAFWDAHTTYSFMNLDKWESLAPESRKIIMDAQLELESQLAEMATKLKAEERSRLEANGVKFTSLSDEEAERFKVMANDSRWEFLETKIEPGRFKRIQSMIRK